MKSDVESRDVVPDTDGTAIPNLECLSRDAAEDHLCSAYRSWILIGRTSGPFITHHIMSDTAREIVILSRE